MNLKLKMRIPLEETVSLEPLNFSIIKCRFSSLISYVSYKNIRGECVKISLELILEDHAVISRDLSES